MSRYRADRGAQPSLRPREIFRLASLRACPPERMHSGWIARAAGALLCLHTTDRATAAARGVEAGGGHHRVPSCTPRRASSRIARRLPCHGSPCRSDSTEARPRFAWMGGAPGEIEDETKTVCQVFCCK